MPLDPEILEKETMFSLQHSIDCTLEADIYIDDGKEELDEWIASWKMAYGFSKRSSANFHRTRRFQKIYELVGKSRKEAAAFLSPDEFRQYCQWLRRKLK